MFRQNPAEKGYQTQTVPDATNPADCNIDQYEDTNLNRKNYVDNYNLKNNRNKKSESSSSGSKATNCVIGLLSLICLVGVGVFYLECQYGVFTKLKHYTANSSSDSKLKDNTSNTSSKLLRKNHTANSSSDSKLKDNTSNTSSKLLRRDHTANSSSKLVDNISNSSEFSKLNDNTSNTSSHSKLKHNTANSSARTLDVDIVIDLELPFRTMSEMNQNSSDRYRMTSRSYPMPHKIFYKKEFTQNANHGSSTIKKSENLYTLLESVGDPRKTKVHKDSKFTQEELKNEKIYSIQYLIATSDAESDETGTKNSAKNAQEYYQHNLEENKSELSKYMEESGSECLDSILRSYVGPKYDCIVPKQKEIIAHHKNDIKDKAYHRMVLECYEEGNLGVEYLKKGYAYYDTMKSRNEKDANGNYLWKSILVVNGKKEKESINTEVKLIAAAASQNKPELAATENYYHVAEYIGKELKGLLDTNINKGTTSINNIKITDFPQKWFDQRFVKGYLETLKKTGYKNKDTNSWKEPDESEMEI